MEKSKKVNILNDFKNKNIALIVIKKLKIKNILDFDDSKFYPGEIVQLDEIYANYVSTQEKDFLFYDENDTIFVCEAYFDTEYPFATNPQLEKNFIEKIKSKCNSYLNIILYLTCNFESQFNLPFYPGFLDNEHDMVVYYNNTYGLPKICKTNNITNFITRNDGLFIDLSNQDIAKYKKIFNNSVDTICLSVRKSNH